MLHSGVGPSPTASNPQSKENLGITDVPRASVDNLKQKSGKTPTKLPDETPDEYLSRLVEAISKAEVAHILAAKCGFLCHQISKPLAHHNYQWGRIS